MNQAKRMFFLLPFLLLICLVGMQFLSPSSDVQFGKGLFTLTNGKENMAYGIVNVSALHSMIYSVQIMMTIYILFYLTKYIRLDVKTLKKEDKISLFLYLLVTIGFIYYLPFLLQDVLNVVAILFK